MNRHVYLSAAILALAGLAIFAYKTMVVGFPVHPGEPALAWDIEARVTFDADGGPAKVTSFLPPDSHGQKVFDYRFVSPGYGASVAAAGPNRNVVLATRDAEGPQILHINFVVHRFVSREPQPSLAEPAPVRHKLEGAALAAARELAALAHRRSSDERTFVTALLQALNGESLADSAKEIAGRKLSLPDRIDAAVRVLSLQGLAARRVNGIDLSGARDKSATERWLEVFIDGAWVSFSAATGEPRVPESYLAWWRGAFPLVRVEGGSNTALKISFVRLNELLLDRVLADGKAANNQIVTLSLFGLPLAAQEVYRVLLVVPLGIFLLVLIRNVIGIRSLGTFMPVLIALAFRETKLVWGIVLFTLVVGSGLLFRAYLENLKLLLVPRLAAVLIFVVGFMAILSVVTHQLGFQRGLSVALFPMVIMSMTIERVSVIWDELGAGQALKQALGSLLIAVLCYLVMFQPIVEHLFFTFPELLLVLLAACMVLGRYSGYRLLELPRFRVLAGD